MQARLGTQAVRRLAAGVYLLDYAYSLMERYKTIAVKIQTTDNQDLYHHLTRHASSSQHA